MGTPGDRGEGREQGGGWQSDWQSGGWQSQWQQPRWQQEPPAQAGPAGWYQTPDGRWVQAAPTSSGKATAALVLGILGLFFCPLVCSVLALVFGYQGRNEIDASGGRMGGRGNATAGLVLGWIGVVIYGLMVLLIVFGMLAFGTDSGGGSPSGVPA
jgi:Domain of unknown function (DUF4190)